VSTFLEVFILIGVALGGSALVLSASTGYIAGLRGPSISIAAASIRQGSESAVEAVELSNTGTSAARSFVIATSQVSDAATFCYSLLGSANETMETTCPSMQQGPASVDITYSLQSGSTVEVELLVLGDQFAIGSTHLVTVTASSGAQQSYDAEVVPA
jgi:hypothetical protein